MPNHYSLFIYTREEKRKTTGEGGRVNEMTSIVKWTTFSRGYVAKKKKQRAHFNFDVIFNGFFYIWYCLIITYSVKIFLKRMLFMSPFGFPMNVFYDFGSLSFPVDKCTYNDRNFFDDFYGFLSFF